jgi:hypothetical protein
LRESVSSFDYEFIVISRKKYQRVWLSQPGDVQLIVLHDNRNIDFLIYAMARHGNKIFEKGDSWEYCFKPVTSHVNIPKVSKLLQPVNVEGIRILHITSFPENTRGIFEALKIFGKVESFDWKKELKKSNRSEMNIALKWKALSFQPTFIFMEECFTGDVLPDTIKHIKSLLSVGVANWCGDIRKEIPRSLIKMGKVVDLSLMSNMPQVNRLNEMGIRATHLHAGAPIWLYRPVEPDRARFPEDIVFLGSGGRKYPLSPLREEMVWMLYKLYGGRFAVYGRGWKKGKYPFVKPFAEPEEDEAILYSSCKVAVGISAFDWEDYTSARMWKAMASGACYLPYYFNGIEKLFKYQEHLAWWKTLADLRAHISYYLNRENDRQTMAKNGYEKVKMEHSWTSRMEAVLRIVQGRKVKVY